MDFADVDCNGEVTLRDLWKKENLGNFSKSFSVKVAPHGAKMYLILK
jgi:hypothetical protein